MERAEVEREERKKHSKDGVEYVDLVGKLSFFVAKCMADLARDKVVEHVASKIDLVWVLAALRVFLSRYWRPCRLSHYISEYQPVIRTFVHTLHVRHNNHNIFWSCVLGALLLSLTGKITEQVGSLVLQ